MGQQTLRYCGTPLKYSFSEANHKKSVTVVELGQKGSVAVRTVPLTPLRELREIRGSYEELTLRANYQGSNTGDYLHVTLTDEEDVPNALDRLRTIYPNIMKLDYDNTRTRAAQWIPDQTEMERKSELELFEDFYAQQNGKPMSREQSDYCSRLIEQLREESL